MAICRGTWPDGSICAHSIFECRECGNIGCNSGSWHCTNSLRDKDDKCAKCGSTGSPKKYIEWTTRDEMKRERSVTADHYVQ
ncbi:MAG TPA: hypothetical protein VFA55_08175 [Candidatus Kapabacteria bacterium]|nr:hypothetical protein [Candidatus Kapabacteria bacterium]